MRRDRARYLQLVREYRERCRASDVMLSAAMREARSEGGRPTTRTEVRLQNALEAEERLKLRTILSPINGVVVKRHFSGGEYVSEEAILTIAQIDPLRVEVAVPVMVYGKIKVGMIGRVTWEAPLVGNHPATVTIVDPVVDAASGTIGVRLELPNPGHRLPAIGS